MLLEMPRGLFDCVLKILCDYMVKKNKTKQNKPVLISDKNQTKHSPP